MWTRTVIPNGKRKAAVNSRVDGFGSSIKKLRLVDDIVSSNNLSDSRSDSDDFDNSDESDGGGARLRPGKTPAKVATSKQKQNSEAKPNTFERGQNSRESHAKQKQLAQERKAAKPLADELHRTKKIWERLRRKSHVPREERQQLVQELFTIITGRIKDFVLKHDAVRAVQTAIKYANPEQRRMISRELKGSYSQLAESRYAKFLIGKLLVQDDEEIRDTILPEFYGKVRRLINHPEASWILDDIYRGAATKKQKAILLREWYGPEFAILTSGSQKDTSPDLADILQEEPSKRSTIMKYLVSMINQLIQKKMTGFTMLHDAMLQYFLNLKPDSEELAEFSEIVRGDENGDLLKNMAFTKSGSRLVCLLLAYGTAKDRKQIVKTYKDTFELMSADQYGHVVILAAYDVVDDTVLTSKTIFPELFGKGGEKETDNVLSAAINPNAKSTIRYLFEGPSRNLLSPADIAVLQEVREIRKTRSKKDDETRRSELVAALSPRLLSSIAASPREYTQDSFGCQLVADVMLEAVGDKTPALQAIASTAAGNPMAVVEAADGYSEPRPHIAQSSHAGRMLKTLIAGGRFDKASGKVKPVEPRLNFSDVLYPVIQDHIMAWATGPSSFVVVNLLEADGFSGGGEVIQTLKRNRAVMEKAASEETVEQKARREAMDKAVPQGKKGARKDLLPGNPGTKILLGKL